MNRASIGAMMNESAIKKQNPANNANPKAKANINKSTPSPNNQRLIRPLSHLL